MILTLAGMTAGLSIVSAEEAQAVVPTQQTQVVITDAAQKAMEAAAVRLSVEEQAFVAKLNDQNRKIFSDKFSAYQRKSAMTAVKNGANADEAIQQIVAAKELQEPSVVNAERVNPAAPAN
jgi:hypothetical protein